MTSRLSLTAVFEPVEGGWTQARLAEIPAVITAAPTLDEAREMLADALSEYLLAEGTAVNGERVDSGQTPEPFEVILGA